MLNPNLIKIPERQHWSEDIQAKTKAIYGVYAYDSESATYCCELTPSYELVYIGTDFDPIDDLPESELEKLDEDITMASGDNEPVTYMHISGVRRLVEANPSLSKKIEIDLKDDDGNELPFGEMADLLMEGWSTGAIRF